MKFTILTLLSFIGLLLAFTVVYLETFPTTYGVSYEFEGEKGYSIVQGNPVEIIDDLKERQFKNFEISPIR